MNAAKNILRFGVAENTTGKGVSPDGSRGKTGRGTPSGGSGDGHVSCPAPSENPMTSVVGVRQRKDNVGQSGYALYFNNTLDPFMQCYIPFSDGKINMQEVADTIQHEINHIFQQHKSRKQYGRNVNYAMAATNMYDIDDAKRVVARVIYLSRDYEQDSIVNGLYAYIMQCLSDGITTEDNKPIQK